MTFKHLLLLRRSTQFKRDLKKSIKQGKDIDLLREVSLRLQHGKALLPKNKDHALGGNWRGYRECHLEPDWLLIYKISHDDGSLHLTRLGSHSELFK